MFSEICYTVPSPYLSALINGDYNGLNEGEIRDCEKFIQAVVELHGHALFSDCKKVGILHKNDINYLFCDCYEITLLINS